ncbi:GNAT family N-acetyltransferase [Streptomyces sp. NPDC059248]|uniref:GNAT family N-acetyltransferase n=1 Tax=Streptomyces sp. NPDC059248 TaxID=3346791 RepID=UPI0036A5D4C9
MPPLATGPRVVLLPFAPSDADEFTAAARASTGHHHPWLFPPRTRDEYARYTSRFGDGSGRAGFLVRETAAGAAGAGDAGRIAGFITINNIVGGAFRSGALGYGAFAHAVGRGLMREALGLVLSYAFGPAMDLHRLEANIQPGNTASIALVRGAGFRLEGYSPDFLFVDGAWRDHERWAITTEMVETRTDAA